MKSLKWRVESALALPGSVVDYFVRDSFERVPTVICFALASTRACDIGQRLKGEVEVISSRILLEHATEENKTSNYDKIFSEGCLLMNLPQDHSGQITLRLCFNTYAKSGLGGYNMTKCCKNSSMLLGALDFLCNREFDTFRILEEANQVSMLTYRHFIKPYHQ